MSATPLDAAHAAMMAAGETEAARRSYFAVLAAAELFVVLEAEAAADRLRPLVVPSEAGDMVLAFDTEARMAAFMGRGTDFAALPGRRLAAMLAGRGLALALNPDAPSAIVLPAEAMAWIAEAGAVNAHVAEGRIRSLGPPDPLPEGLLGALDRALAGLSGLASAAYLASAEMDRGRRATLLVLADVPGPAEAACARALAEALALGGFGADALEIAFTPGDGALAARLAHVAIRFDIPAPSGGLRARPPASDPGTPPRLR